MRVVISIFPFDVQRTMTLSMFAAQLLVQVCVSWVYVYNDDD